MIEVRGVDSPVVLGEALRTRTFATNRMFTVFELQPKEKKRLGFWRLGRERFVREESRQDRSDRAMVEYHLPYDTTLHHRYNKRYDIKHVIRYEGEELEQI